MLGTLGILKGQNFVYFVCMIDKDAISRRFEAIRPALTERGRRLFAALPKAGPERDPRGEPELVCRVSRERLVKQDSGIEAKTQSDTI